jgi:hypothetical protein
MASRITLPDAQAWINDSKLVVHLGTLDTDLEAQVTEGVLSRLRAKFSTIVDLWVDPATTPREIRNIIAMRYVGWLIARVYASEESLMAYSNKLLKISDLEIADLLSGDTQLVLDESGQGLVNAYMAPVGFPDDASSNTCPTDDNPSDGGPYFLMGKVW